MIKTFEQATETLVLRDDQILHPMGFSHKIKRLFV